MINLDPNVIKAYTDEPVSRTEELAGGHINRSFLVTCSERYVLQCLNTEVFADHLKYIEDNYLKYRARCQKAGGEIGEWCCPEWLRDKEGQLFHRDKEGRVYRMYRYIYGDIPGEADPYEAGAGLGKLHRLLNDLKSDEIKDVLPNLHDLSYYYDRYLEQNDSHINRDPQIDKLIDQNIRDMLRLSRPAGRVIHGDAKVSNMIMRNGKVVGFIDLDTMMWGSVFDDIADCIRSCCMKEDGGFDNDGLARLLSGYKEGAGVTFAHEDKELAKEAAMRSRFMVGLRYYTDYLAGGKYFREEYPGQDLDKARRLMVF